jgi:hypothetical protein
MTTILGHHIRYVRPEKPRMPIIFKSDLPYARRQSCTKTIKEHCGKVVAVSLMLIGGGIRSVSSPATHLKVLEVFDIDPEKVAKTGWLLENGNYIWR